MNTCSQFSSFLSSEEPHCPLAEGREGPGWACGKDSCRMDPQAEGARERNEVSSGFIAMSRSPRAPARASCV